MYNTIRLESQDQRIYQSTRAQLDSGWTSYELLVYVQIRVCVYWVMGVILVKILVDFRNRWNKEYLLLLREQFKHKTKKVKIHPDVKTCITENFWPSKSGKRQIAVVKCMIKGRIATLTRPISRSIVSKLAHTLWMKMFDQN